MSATAQDAWKGFIDPDETILWQGRPGAGVTIRPKDAPISLFGLVFLAFAIFWTAMASSMSGGTGPVGYVFPLFGIPFILVGAYLVGGRFFWEAYRRAHSWYTLTDRRAFIATDMLGHRTLKEYPIDADAEITLVEERKGQSVYFAEVVRRGAKGRRYTVPIGFELLPDGREVYAVLRDLRTRARQARSGGAA